MCCYRYTDPKKNEEMGISWNHKKTMQNLHKGIEHILENIVDVDELNDNKKEVKLVRN
jgi:hypothetical protein